MKVNSYEAFGSIESPQRLCKARSVEYAQKKEKFHRFCPIGLRCSCKDLLFIFNSIRKFSTLDHLSIVVFFSRFLNCVQYYSEFMKSDYWGPYDL